VQQLYTRFWRYFRKDSEKRITHCGGDILWGGVGLPCVSCYGLLVVNSQLLAFVV